MDIQICNICDKSLPLNSFDKSDISYRKTCKTCRYERTKELREEKRIINLNKLEFAKEKKCSKCNKVKKLDEFNLMSTSNDGIATKCRECYNKSRSKRTEVKDIVIQTKSCNTCNTSKPLSEFKTTSRSTDGHFHKCKSCWKPTEWTKEKQHESEKRYCDKNKEKLKLKWQKDGQNLSRKIKSRLSNRIKDALKAISLTKNNKTMSYLGCSHIQLRQWFEFLFLEGMTWDNIGQWHIDHVVPCASFDLTKPEDIESCFNWKNIRPCWQKENLEKGSQLIPEVVEAHMSKVKQFLNNPLPSPPGDREGGTN